jgi:phenylacetaldehyde dehydrogenase
MAANLSENDLGGVAKEVRQIFDRPAAHYIDGAWQRAERTIPVLDPSSGRQFSEIARGGTSEIEAAVKAAGRALKSREWGECGPIERERLLHRLADLIDQKTSTLSTVETVDNGMPLWFSTHLDVSGAAGVYRYFAGWPTKLTGDTVEVGAPPGLGQYLGFTRREPVGVVGAIIPWNVPFMLAAWKLAPALAAGCTVVLKPAEDTSLSALLLAELVQEAGFPKGVVNVVTGLGAEAGEALIKHPGVTKISFTGSTATGRRVGALAGEHLKRVTLELGGKSPTLIFGDANLDEAVPGAATSIFMNSGQICVAGSRLYVQDSIYDAVMERLEAHLKTLTVGPGLAPDIFMGPLVNAKQRDRVIGYIAGARKGAPKLLQGNSPQSSSGFYVSPTVLTGAKHDDPITQEEVFGPVLSVYRFKETEEALATANGTTYGLSASVWSRDVQRVLQVAAKLECGKVTVNAAGFPYPGLPEGGYKGSGFGKDLGQAAVEQCLQTKTIMIRTG